MAQRFYMFFWRSLNGGFAVFSLQLGVGFQYSLIFSKKWLRAQADR